MARDLRGPTVYIPQAGVIWLGCPHPWPVELESVKVMYDEEVRTADQDFNAADPWLNWNWVYWDPFDDTAKICSLSGGDDATIRPWHHYRVFFNIPQEMLDPRGPYLIIPEPEFEFGGG